MSALTSKHLITGDEFSEKDILDTIHLARDLKNAKTHDDKPLQNKHVALVFEKPSVRTRFSFTAAVNQLGGQVIESISQSRKQEQPKDFIRVIQGYCDAMMIRTYDDSVLSEMQAHAKIPIINGLTDLYHPCQALADLMTLQECFNDFSNLKIAYIGDGNNVLHSLIMMANKLGIEVHYCTPKGHEPKQDIIAAMKKPNLVKAFIDPKEAVKACHAVYADVWTSMGFAPSNENNFSGYQVNEALMKNADPNAVFMHCMPMERGKEVSDTLPDTDCSVIFQQSENRMHVQKAILINLMNV